MLLTIPKFRKPAEIARKLRLPEPLVRSSLQTLAELGLAVTTDGQWRPGSTDLHLAEGELWTRVYHGNWRQRTALRIQEGAPDDLHYSGVHTMSLADARRVKQMLIQFLESSRKVIGPSPEEELFFVGCDFYGL